MFLHFFLEKFVIFTGRDKMLYNFKVFLKKISHNFSCFLLPYPHSTVLTTQGMQFLSMLEAMLNKAIPLPFRDVLLHMMAINIYRMSTLQADCKRRQCSFHLFFFSIFFHFYQIFFCDFWPYQYFFSIESELFWIISSDLHSLPTIKAFYPFPHINMKYNPVQ